MEEVTTFVSPAERAAKKQAEELAELAEYDYFEKLHKEHIKDLRWKELEHDRKRKDDIRVESLLWRRGGVEVQKNLDGQMDQVGKILNPHRFKKEAMRELESFAEVIEKEYAKMHKRAYSKKGRRGRQRLSKANKWTLVESHDPLIRVWEIDGEEDVDEDSVTTLDTAGSSKNEALLEDTRPRTGKLTFYAATLLRKIKPYGRTYSIRTNLVMQKTSVMAQIRTDHKILHCVDCTVMGRTHFPVYTHTKAVPALSLLRRLFRHAYEPLVVDPSAREYLYKLRDSYRFHRKKLDIVRATMKKCEYMYVCDSILHQSSKGCQKCGLLWRGGTMGPEKFVMQIHRDTGVRTLIRLEDEIVVLNNEDANESRILDDIEVELFPYEDTLFDRVGKDSQIWLTYVLAYRRLRKKQNSMDRSLRRFHSRQMILMKREVDQQIRHPLPLNTPQLMYRYAVIAKATDEYILWATEQKRLRIMHAERKFFDNLRSTVMDARQRRLNEAQELARQMSLDALIPKPVRIKKSFPRVGIEKQYICARPECRLRKFLTKERYEVHQGIHAREDIIRYKKYADDVNAKFSRDCHESVFLRRVAESRNYIKDHMLNVDDITSDTQRNVARMDNEKKREFQLSAEELEVLANMADGIGEGSTAGSALDNNTKGSSGVSSYSIGSIDSGTVDSTAEWMYPQADWGEEFSAFSLRSHSLGSSLTLLYPHSTTSEGTSESLRREQMHAMLSHRSHLHDWAQFPHVHTLNNLFNTPLYSLELVSRQGDVTAPIRVPLDKPVVRIGTHSSCECLVTLDKNGAARRLGKVGKIHCMLYCPMGDANHRMPPVPPMSSSASTSSLPSATSTAKDVVLASLTKEAASTETPSNAASSDKVTLVDNSSVWGTYISTASGTVKVPQKISAGVPLMPGMLVCVAVLPDGPAALSPSQANGACVVYRVRLFEENS